MLGKLWKRSGAGSDARDEAYLEETRVRPSRSHYLLLFLLLLCASAASWIVLHDTSGRETAVFGCYRERSFLLCAALTYACLWSFLFLVYRFGKTGCFRIVAAHLGLLLAVGLIEMAAFFGFIDFRPYLEPEGKGKCFGRSKADERLRWSGVPNQRYEGTVHPNLTRIFNIETEPVPFEIETDRFGLRNPVGKGEPEIFLLGDSQLYAALVPVEETMAERVEDQLGVTTLNVSESGYSAEEGLIRLESTGADPSGKLIVHFIFEGNDLSGSATWRSWLERPFEYDWPASGLLKNLLTVLHSPKAPTAATRCGIFSDRRGEEVAIYFLYDAVTVAGRMEAFDGLAAYLADSGKRIESQGGTYAIVFLPSKYTVYHQYCRWPEGSDFESLGEWTSPFGSKLAEVCKESGIPFRDVTPPLQDLAARGILTFFPADTHLNSRGHESIALFLESWIRDLRRK